MLKTVSEALILAESELKDAFPEAKREGLYILGYALGWPITKLIAYPDYTLTEAEYSFFTSVLQRRKVG